MNAELFREEADGRFYISMEFIDGERLRSRIDRTEVLSAGEPLAMSRQMLDRLLTCP